MTAAPIHDIVRFVDTELGKLTRADYDVLESAANIDGDYVYIPVHLDVADAWEKAEILQKTEDAWNDREPRETLRLLLVPAKRT